MELTLSEKCLSDFLVLIHTMTGISISTNRSSMIEGRLRKRVKSLGLPNYEDYLQLVKSDKKEQVCFIDLVTTNETYFFRTPRVWEYIEKKFLPNWFAQNPKKVFTVWSAAASSGEEAHSLGVICQAFKDKNPSFLYQIVGTDISQEMIQKCQKGEYSGRSIESFKSTRPELFLKYMKPIGSDVYQVTPEIKTRLRFQTHNLFKPYPSQDLFDLVLVRNVLIYFKSEDQEKVLSLIGTRLSKEGALIIGESESLSHISTPFKQIEPLVYSFDKVS